jgi:hypothetical protein
MKPHMTLKTCIALTALALSGPPQWATAQGNLVINGAFDTDASGWTITNVGSGGGYLSSFGNPPGSVILGNPSLPGVPTASQEINDLTPGSLYIVSGEYRTIAGKDVIDSSFGVALEGVFLFEATAPADSNWYSFNFDYTAASSSALLSLAAQINGTDVSYGIDNIAMYVTPEPSATSVILLGGGLLLYVHKRYRHMMQTKLD